MFFFWPGKGIRHIEARRPKEVSAYSTIPSHMLIWRRMKLYPAVTYQDVLWNRQHYLPARLWWHDIRMEVKKKAGGKCEMCGKNCENGDVHHTPEAYKYIGYEDYHLDLLQWVHRTCHQNYHRRKTIRKMLRLK